MLSIWLKVTKKFIERFIPQKVENLIIKIMKKNDADTDDEE